MNLLNARSHQAAREPNLLFASMKKKKASPESWCRSILQTEMKTVYQRRFFKKKIFGFIRTDSDDSVLHSFFLPLI